MPEIVNANVVDIMFDGKPIPGLKGFTFKIYKDKREIPAIGSRETFGYSYGKLHIRGQILVHSNSTLLNEHMENDTTFQITINMPLDPFMPGSEGAVKNIAFDECHVEDREFSLDAHGYAVTTYTWSAVRIREA
mgnify:CR=1 FL=1